VERLRIAALIPVLQVAIGPVILISGIGLLLLSMTNRFGRIIDRSRILAVMRREGTAEVRQRADAQVAILWRRAQLVRRAIVCACVSLLLAAVLVVVLFVATAAGLELAWLVVVLFIACLGALVVSLVAFLKEIDESLLALRLDLFES
jgi:Protein of unknown function (DUF2721)